MLESLKTHGDLHLSRKLFHVLCLLFIFACMMWLPTQVCWIMYALGGLPLIFMDYYRRHSPAFNRFSLKIIGPVIRKHEVRKLSGLSWAAMSVGLVFLIFPKPICLLAILFLAIGDPTASLFGLLFGKTKIFGNKSVAGTVAAFIACSITSLIFISLYPKPLGVDGALAMLGLSLACGAIAAISELVSFFDLDDNLTQPLVSSLLLTALFWQLSGVTYG